MDQTFISTPNVLLVRDISNDDFYVSGFQFFDVVFLVLYSAGRGKYSDRFEVSCFLGEYELFDDVLADQAGGAEDQDVVRFGHIGISRPPGR